MGDKDRSGSGMIWTEVPAVSFCDLSEIIKCLYASVYKFVKLEVYFSQGDFQCSFSVLNYKLKGDTI